MKPEFCSKCPNPYYCKGVCRPCYMKVYRQLPDQVEKRKRHHKEHYIAKKADYAARQKKWNALNPEKRRQFTDLGWKKYRETNPKYKELVSFWSRSRQARKEERTPPWADLDKIREIYLNRPKGYHVDHIIPLNGENVSGLHVHYNLQYLPAKENLSKGNKLILDYV